MSFVVPTWPTWLVPLYDSFSSSVGSPKKVFKTDTGPGIDWPLATDYVRTQSWESIIPTRERFDALLRFYKVTTNQGTILASGTEPLTRRSALMRIEKIKFQKLAGTIWRVTMTVEVV